MFVLYHIHVYNKGKRENITFLWKKPVSLSWADLEEFCHGQFFYCTRKPNVFHLSYTRSFSTGKNCFYLHVLLYHFCIKEKEITFSFYEKKLYLFVMQTIKNPSLVNFLDNRMRWSWITWVKLGLSLQDKLCLFLNFFLYHIYIQEKEKTFPFYGRILSWSLFFWQHKKLKRL